MIGRDQAPIVRLFQRKGKSLLPGASIPRKCGSVGCSPSLPAFHLELTRGRFLEYYPSMITKLDSTALQLTDLKALETILKTLEPLSADERERVLRWASEKLGIQQAVLGRAGSGAVKKTAAIDVAFEKHPGGFQNVGEFLAAASPASDADRVLCVAVYLQDFSESPDATTLSGKQINDELKNLGHGVKNITDSINTLKSRKPQHMIQTRKAGRAKQAWKEYRVTRAGVEHAYRLISEGNGENQV
jgi:hypothetical protein